MPDDIIAAIEVRLKKLQNDYERLVKTDIEKSPTVPQGDRGQPDLSTER